MSSFTVQQECNVISKIIRKFYYASRDGAVPCCVVVWLWLCGCVAEIGNVGLLCPRKPREGRREHAARGSAPDHAESVPSSLRVLSSLLFLRTLSFFSTSRPACNEERRAEGCGVRWLWCKAALGKGSAAASEARLSAASQRGAAAPWRYRSILGARNLTWVMTLLPPSSRLLSLWFFLRPWSSRMTPSSSTPLRDRSSASSVLFTSSASAKA